MNGIKFWKKPVFGPPDNNCLLNMLIDDIEAMTRRERDDPTVTLSKDAL